MPCTPPVDQRPAGGIPTNSNDVVVVKELPIQTFGGDIAVAASSDVTIDATLTFADRCTGYVLQGITGTVQIAINSGALRTVDSNQALNDAYIRQIRIVTAAASTAILQLHGE
jgi:hypothetical protein